MANIIISTGDIKYDYDVIDTVFSLGTGEAGVFSSGSSNAFKDVKSKLISECKKLGGDAVIFCQFEYRMALGDGLFGKKQLVEIFAYGTAVRIRKN